MDNLRISFITVMPLLLYMLTGVLARKAGVLDQKTSIVFTKLVANILLPFMLFKTVYKGSFDSSLHPEILIYTLSASVVLMLIGILFFNRAEKDPPKTGALIIGSTRGNVALFGLSILAEISENIGSGDMALAALVILIFTVVGNALEMRPPLK